MAKRDKKYSSEQAAQDTTQDAPVATTEVAGEAAPAKEAKPRAPSLFVQDAEGIQFRFTRYPLPRKALSDAPVADGEIIVDGNVIPYFTTHNSGWAKEGTAIEYAYFKVGDVTGYVTLSKDEPFKGKEFTFGEGEANRENPKKVSANPDTDKTRSEAAKKTRDEKAAVKAAAEAAGATEATA